MRATLAQSLFLAASALLMSVGAAAAPADDAEAAFAKFFPAFVAHNQDQVAAMFAADAQFYGTLSPQLVTTPQGVHRYFATALERPDAVVATPLQMSANALSDSVVLLAGLWKVERTLDDKRTAGGPYRFTAVMQKRQGGWTVVQFHNSALPPPPAPAAPAPSALQSTGPR